MQSNKKLELQATGIRKEDKNWETDVKRNFDFFRQLAEKYFKIYFMLFINKTHTLMCRSQFVVIGIGTV
jgi:hypothetical protein